MSGGLNLTQQCNSTPQANKLSKKPNQQQDLTEPNLNNPNITME